VSKSYGTYNIMVVNVYVIVATFEEGGDALYTFNDAKEPVSKIPEKATSKDYIRVPYSVLNSQTRQSVGLVWFV
jgi:hypothetical protein